MERVKRGKSESYNKGVWDDEMTTSTFPLFVPFSFISLVWLADGVSEVNVFLYCFFVKCSTKGRSEWEWNGDVGGRGWMDGATGRRRRIRSGMRIGICMNSNGKYNPKTSEKAEDESKKNEFVLSMCCLNIYRVM